MVLDKQDQEVHTIIEQEQERQATSLTLIPSENFASKAVREAEASVLMNKYSEGYPGKRYYQGNTYADQIEQLAIDRAKKLFGAEHANVQGLAGSVANWAIYFAFLEPGDTVLGYKLSSGGHLTHGASVNFSGKYFNAVQYDVDPETHRINMDTVRSLAQEHKPKMIISGLTAYSRTLDFAAFNEIAKEVGAIHLADVSHLSGLIAAGVHPSPVPHADVVMTTTHKTLRGPRGALILCKEEHAKRIDKAIMPGVQGGPFNHVHAAKAVAFQEAISDAFKAYGNQVVKNAQALSETLQEGGLQIVTGGTDNHMMLIDLQSIGPKLGKKAAVALEHAGIVVNMNTVPYDPAPPFRPSGLRVGTPYVTTRGMKENEMQRIGEMIVTVVKNMEDFTILAKIREEVRTLCQEFPLPQ